MAESAAQFDQKLYIELRHLFPGIPEAIISSVIRRNVNDRNKCLDFLNQEQLRHGPYADPTTIKPLTVNTNTDTRVNPVSGSLSDTHVGNNGFIPYNNLMAAQNIYNHQQMFYGQQHQPGIRQSTSFPNVNVGQYSPNAFRPRFDGGGGQQRFTNGNFNMEPNSEYVYNYGYQQNMFIPRQRPPLPPLEIFNRFPNPRMKGNFNSFNMTSPNNMTNNSGYSGGNFVKPQQVSTSEHGAQTPGSDPGTPQSNNFPPHHKQSTGQFSEPKSLITEVMQPIQSPPVNVVNAAGLHYLNGQLDEPVSGTGHLLAEEMAYTQAYLLHQKRSLENLRNEYGSLNNEVDELKQIVDVMENKQLNRQQSTEKIISREDLKNVQEENRRIKVEAQITLQEIENIKNGQGQFGYINPNEQGSFHNSLTETGPHLPPSTQSNVIMQVPFEPPRPPTPGDMAEGENWNCGACTFLNHYALEKCEVCEFPKIKAGKQQPCNSPCYCHDANCQLSSLPKVE